MFSMNAAFNINDSYDAYYNLIAVSSLETAMRNIIHNTIDNYCTAENIFIAEHYMYCIGIYEKTVMLGYDAAIKFYTEEREGIHVAISPEKYEKYTNQIKDLGGKKKDRADGFQYFEDTVENEYTQKYLLAY